MVEIQQNCFFPKGSGGSGENMSMEYCFICDKNIDTDYDVEHECWWEKKEDEA